MRPIKNQITKYTMNKNIFSFLIVGLIGFGFVACNEPATEGSDEAAVTNETKIDTDVVKNDASAQAEVDPATAPAFSWEKESHDFGEIAQGEKVAYSFKFTNNGKSDLIISSAKGSCGCTVPEYSKEPLAPGQEGKIDVIFDSKGKSGAQNKKVTIVANTVPNQAILTIIGNVNVPVTEEAGS
ncbi:MAG: hypothetical protein ACI9YU_001671 [Flavobacteriales bacterium]